jgi:hypothetical protein
MSKKYTKESWQTQIYHLIFLTLILSLLIFPFSTNGIIIHLIVQI